MIIEIPHNFEPRGYQLEALRGFNQDVRRAILLWHRRAGKDKLCVNITAMKSQERVGSYYYFLPTYQQGKKIIWEGIDGSGVPFLSHFPEALIASKNNTEMKLTLKNGSIFRVVGSDQIDSIVGTNPVGCVFSEYAIQDPQGWDFVRPILRENGGWALFPYTPRGKNHGYDLYEMAKNNPSWYVSKLSVEDTGIMSKEDINEERRAGMDEELIQQEFYCSFKAPLQGAYYGNIMDEIEDRGQILDKIPYDPELPVDTWWDLGMGDSTFIVFVQTHYGQIRAIDSYENSGEGLQHYIRLLSQKNYLYGRHIAPHDIGVKELGTGKSRWEVAQKLGLRFDVAPKLSVEHGIDAVRSMLQNMWFSREKCPRLIEALRHYHKEWDPLNKVWKAKPYHDWSSHACDSVRTGAVGRKGTKLKTNKDRYSVKNFNKQKSWMSA